MTVQVVSFFFSNCTDHIIEIRLHKYASSEIMFTRIWDSFSWCHEKLRKAIPYTREHLFSMYLPPLEIGAAQIRSVTPLQPFLCVNRSPSRYGFRGGAKAIQYSVNKASASLPKCNLAKLHWEQLLSVFNRELTLFPRYSHVFIPRYAPKPLHTITSITHYMEKN